MSCNASWLLGLQLLSQENGQGTWGHYGRGGKTRTLTPTLFALPDLASDQAFLVGHLTLGLLFLN